MVMSPSYFENCYFSPNSVLNFRKNYQIWGNWLKNKKVTGKHKLEGGKHPPPQALIGLKRKITVGPKYEEIL